MLTDSSSARSSASMRWSSALRSAAAVVAPAMPERRLSEGGEPCAFSLPIFKNNTWFRTRSEEKVGHRGDATVVEAGIPIPLFEITRFKTEWVQVHSVHGRFCGRGVITV